MTSFLQQYDKLSNVTRLRLQLSFATTNDISETIKIILEVFLASESEAL